MKRPGFFAASAAAVSATAISCSNHKIQISHEFSSLENFTGQLYDRLIPANLLLQKEFLKDGSSNRRDESSSEKGGSSSGKFAPRFDGLRFIETLVTGHR